MRAVRTRPFRSQRGTPGKRRTQWTGRPIRRFPPAFRPATTPRRQSGSHGAERIDRLPEAPTTRWQSYFERKGPARAGPIKTFYEVDASLDLHGVSGVAVIISVCEAHG